MNRLRKTGTALAVTGALFSGGCSVEQASSYSNAAPAPAPEYSIPATIASETPSATAKPEIAQQQRMAAILGKACTYVVGLENLTHDGTPNVWDTGSPMFDYSKQYNILADPTGASSPYDPFDSELKQTCHPFAEIYSKNN